MTGYAEIEHKDWHSWTPERGMTKLEWFDNEQVDRKCTIPCEDCGFHYLADDGSFLSLKDWKPVQDNKTPLCGVW